jgi:hypothetical protein
MVLGNLWRCVLSGTYPILPVRLVTLCYDISHLTHFYLSRVYSY